MVMPIDFLPHEPTDGATDEDVGREMLLSADTRCTHGCGQTIRKKGRERTGIFMSDDTCNGPCRCGMLGGKRNASLPETPAVIVRERSLPTKRILHCVGDGQTVYRRLAGQKPSLALVIVVRKMPPQIKPTPDSNERAHPVIRNILAVFYAVCGIREMLAGLRIGRQHRRQSTPQGN